MHGRGSMAVGSLAAWVEADPGLARHSSQTLDASCCAFDGDVSRRGRAHRWAFQRWEILFLFFIFFFSSSFPRSALINGTCTTPSFLGLLVASTESASRQVSFGSSPPSVGPRIGIEMRLFATSNARRWSSDPQPTMLKVANGLVHFVDRAVRQSRAG